MQRMTNKTYSSLNVFIRSSVFFIFCTITIPLYSLLCALSFMLPIRVRHAMIRAYLKVLMVVFEKVCHVRYHVTGVSNIPTDHVGVILSKHQSTWETFFLPTIFHDPAVIAKRELAWIPFFGWGLAAADPIFINRSSKSSAMQQIITKGKKCLEQGRWILVFPEGTRIPAGKVGIYKLGGARLAVHMGCPVIPVAHNAGYVWPRRGFLKHPGTIHLAVGPIIETTGKTPEAVMEEAKNWIESAIEKMPSLG